MENEIWKDIKGYEGLYKVSNLGRVKSLERINSLGRKVRAKILKTPTSIYGYCLVDLCKGGVRKTFRVHRLVAETFLDNTLMKEVVNHKDGNKLNNKLENLEWATVKENTKHAYDSGIYKISNETKKKMSNSAKGKGVKRVICVTTGEIFESLCDARDYAKLSKQSSGVSRCCRGVSKSAGKHPVTGEKLIWKFY